MKPILKTGKTWIKLAQKTMGNFSLLSMTLDSIHFMRNDNHFLDQYIFTNWGFIFCVLFNCNLLWILREMFLRHFVLVHNNIWKMLALIEYTEIFYQKVSQRYSIGTNIVLRGLNREGAADHLGIDCLLSLLLYFVIVKVSYENPRLRKKYFLRVENYFSC